MKKIVFCALMLCVTLSALSQEDTTAPDVYEKYNEVKINGIFLLIGAIEASYERNLSESSSVGISAFVPFDVDIDLNYYVSPYYRVFFGNKYAAGFFLEGFGMLNSVRNEEYYFISNGDSVISYSEGEDYTNFALGLGVGGKWVVKNGFTFELVGGIGRNLLDTKDSDVEIVGKLGFNLGYRF
ncbi:DUF3575 domain-containing protein [Sediminibacter sp. Hel_I_10]|uniref:DUF3575 domain-containing protein n=1 Tax=Sediminibacter sp. Hel_I_10 TaxID=1392490 RepID=UPI00047E613C|nr:DUF3575 domain-containing protein [Sediminibacter sp. Hel_I_10]